MMRASSLAVLAETAAAVPVIIRHSDPSLLTVPSSASVIRFDIWSGVSRFVRIVIWGNCVRSSAAGLGSAMFGNSARGIWFIVAALFRRRPGRLQIGLFYLVTPVISRVDASLQLS